jgi:threonine dehydrogenase-like Zn-dependent dehydrogenase
MSFDVASSFIVTYGTSYHALKDRAHLKSGEWLVVLGAAGGVGLAAVEIGCMMGAKVVAGASTQEKVDLAVRRGALDGFVYPHVPLGRDQQKALSARIKERRVGRARTSMIGRRRHAEPLRAMVGGVPRDRLRRGRHPTRAVADALERVQHRRRLLGPRRPGRTWRTPTRWS